ncbi:S1C family serine protease [Egibacter rhizosphaerae]|uniref:S1C family serine protease n=1 Tax=Egibacter rhizosphaerae TaxID=1670831 RepID=UPI0013F16A2E|nr:serine protease [Egibacter rhizosphaerae]
MTRRLVPAARRLGSAGAAVLLLASCLAVPPDDDVHLERESAPAADEGTPSHGPDASAEIRAESVERLAREATTRVRAVGCDRLRTGSGVHLGDGLVVTNRHVVDQADEVSINSWDGTRGEARTVGVADDADIALLQVDEAPVEHVVLTDTDPEPEERLVLLGHPGGGPQVVARGPVLGYLAPEELPDLEPHDEVLRIGALVSPGSSGGPVLDGQGRLAAVVFAYEAGAGHALAIPATQLEAFVDTRPRDLAPPAGCR